MKKYILRFAIAVIVLISTNLLLFLVVGSTQGTANATTPDPGIPGPYSVSVGIDERGDSGYEPPSVATHTVELRSTFYYPTTGEDSGATGQAKLSILQRLCLQLEAVLTAHLEKEERVYIPLFEKYLSEEEQQRILNGMHEAYEPAPAAGTAALQVPLLDVREIAPRQRHELIFDTFKALKSGEAFILINDHDPKPLYYQFKAELEGLFTWDYLEQGPDVWRVRIGAVLQQPGHPTSRGVVMRSG